MSRLDLPTELCPTSTTLVVYFLPGASVSTGGTVVSSEELQQLMSVLTRIKMSAILWDTYVITPYSIVRTQEEALPLELSEELIRYQHNLSYYLTRLHSTWNPLLELREFDDFDADTFQPTPGVLVPDFTRATYRVTLTVCEGSKRIRLDDDQRQQLTQLADDASKHTTRIILDLRRNLCFQSVVMSSQWLQNIAPTIPNTDIIDNALWFPSTAEDFNGAYMSLLRQLLQLYNYGVVVVTDNHPAIADWELQPYGKFYHPKWSNSLLAPHISEFLVRVTMGQTTFPIHLGNGIVESISATTYSQAATTIRQLYR
jgi:hypothetical protein